MANNPIFWKDLISPDDSIDKLIKKLDELGKTYEQSLGGIIKEAAKLLKALEKVNGATHEGQEETKKAADMAEKLKRAQKQLADAQDENAESLERIKQKIKEQNQINRLNVRIANSAEGSYNRLSAEYAKLKIQINAMTEAERQNTAEGKRLVQQSKEMYDKMKELQEQTGKTALNVGNYTESIKQALGINNQFGNSLLALGASGKSAAGVFAAMKAGAIALGATLKGLMANPAFLAVAGVAAAGTAFKFWFDYNAGLVEATKLTKQFTGLAGQELKDVREEVSLISDKFDKDFQETLIAANALSKQFGISIEQALGDIRDGFFLGADAGGEFLDIVKEYPAFFKEAGLSAENFVAIVAQTTKQGIYSDKGIDAIKEGNVRIREMTASTAKALDGIGISSNEVQRELRNGSKTTFDIMQEVSRRLGEFPEQSAEVGTALADIFGGAGEDAGLQFIKTLGTINTDLESLKKNMDEVAVEQYKAYNAELRFRKALAGVFDTTDGTFETLTSKAKAFVYNILADMLEYIINVSNSVIELYNNSTFVRNVWNGIVVAAKSFFSLIRNSQKAIFDLFKAVLLQIEAITTLDWDKMKQGVAGYGKAFQKLGQNVKRDIAEALKDFNKDVEKKIEPLKIPARLDFKTEGGGGGKSIEMQTKAFKSKALKSLSFGKQTLSLDTDLKLASPKFSKKDLAFAEELAAERENVLKRVGKVKRSQAKDFYDLMGLNLNDEQKNAINSSVEFAKEQLNAVMEAKVAAADRAVESAQRETDAAQENLNRELEARNAGYANNVEQAQKDLELAKKTEEQAIKNRQKAQKQQMAVQSIEQIGNLVTSTSLIWSQLGFPWAIPAIATMWGSFAASKIKAAQMVKNEKYANGTIELLKGGSHASGNDIDLGTKEDGTQRRAEGGEYFAVINKRSSRKFRSVIPNVINALNDGSFADKYMNAYSTDGVNLNVHNEVQDLGSLRDDVKAIRQQGDSRSYIDADGSRVLEYRNLKRRIK